MIQRGRKSAQSLSIVRVDGAPPKLKPPPSLTKAERVLFLELIEASGCPFRKSYPDVLVMQPC